MDEIEIINNEYCQFIYWVCDFLVYVYLDYYIINDDGDECIDWELDIDWEDDIFEDFYYQGDDCFVGCREIDVSKFVYEYQWYDWQVVVKDCG